MDERKRPLRDITNLPPTSDSSGKEKRQKTKTTYQQSHCWSDEFVQELEDNNIFDTVWEIMKSLSEKNDKEDGEEDPLLIVVFDSTNPDAVNYVNNGNHGLPPHVAGSLPWPGGNDMIKIYSLFILVCSMYIR
jgi:hypothetical protein